MDELSRLRGSEGYEVCLDEVKQKRAQGECLGTGSRRRTRQAAISCGEAQIAIDPQISEWGNLARVRPRNRILNT